MPKIRAKFRVHNINKWADGEGVQQGERVQMSPVYSSDLDSENHSFSKYTPSGSIDMSITNPNAFGAFVEGGEYYIDFTPATA